MLHASIALHGKNCNLLQHAELFYIISHFYQKLSKSVDVRKYSKLQVYLALLLGGDPTAISQKPSV